MVNRIKAMAVVLLLVCGLTVPAFAAHPVPDLSRPGSITFVMSLEGTALNGGKLNLYQVGEIVEDDGNYSFGLIEALRGSGLSLTDLSDAKLAQNLLEVAKAVKLPKITESIQEGAAVFSSLPVGLYLAFQNEADATKGYSALQPFFISVPQLQGDTYVLDIIARPKVPLKPAPPTPPPPPPPPEIPPTGQLNWPVPVMASLGGLLLVLGLILCARGKRT